jgi:hypothetical protein
MENLARGNLADAQLLRNRGVAFSTSRPNQRGALAIGQRRYRRKRGSELSTPVDFVRAPAILPLLIKVVVTRSPRGELGQRDITRDPVQPRTQPANLDSRAQCP